MPLNHTKQQKKNVSINTIEHIKKLLHPVKDKGVFQRLSDMD